MVVMGAPTKTNPRKKQQGGDIMYPELREEEWQWLVLLINMCEAALRGWNVTVEIAGRFLN
jgi:hypothetical protein